MTHTTAKNHLVSSSHPLRVLVGILLYRLVREKTRIVYLPDGEKIFSGYVEPLRQTTCVRQTDRETDGQTSYGSIVRAVHSIAR